MFRLSLLLYGSTFYLIFFQWIVDDIEESEKDTSEEEAENKEGEEDQTYDHLHQIFITKNFVLCSEVQKNFKEMSNACDVVRHFVSQKEQPLPHRIQDIGDNQFPIFMTSKKLLLMLDASLKGPCFFERNDDGSLKVNIVSPRYSLYWYMYDKCSVNDTINAT